MQFRAPISTALHCSALLCSCPLTKEGSAQPHVALLRMQCGDLCPYQNFSAHPVQNISTDGVLTINLPKILHIGKYLVYTHNKKCRSRIFFINISALGSLTNIQTWTSQLVKVGLTVSHISVKACHLDPHPWKCGCAFLGALGVGALLKLSHLGCPRINCLEIRPIFYNW